MSGPRSSFGTPATLSRPNASEKPSEPTILMASSVARFRSSEAPLETLSNTSSSVSRPASSIAKRLVSSACW